jgi:DNA polymerase I
VIAHISLLIGSLKEIRVNHFKKLSKTSDTQELRDQYDMIAQALKVFLNASYGVIGADIFALFYVPVAESITAVGRDIITQTAETAGGMGIKVIYGDTDSLFIHQPTKEQVEELMRVTSKKYNIDLEVDKIYRYVVFSNRKKNYFGIKQDGKVDIKGLVGKKSSTPPFLKKLFGDIMDELKKVMVDADFVPAKKNICTMVSDTIKNFDDIPLVELAFKMKINKDPSEYKGNSQHVKVGKQLPKDIEKGQVIKYIKTWTREKVKPLELAERREVDKEKYMETMETVISQVIEPMDIEFNSLTGYGKQTSLSDW